MDGKLLYALGRELEKLWEEVRRQALVDLANPTYWRKLARAASRWRGACQTLGIITLEEDRSVGPGGTVFAERVVVADPNPAGMWLEMTHETAEKILARDGEET